MSGRRVSEAQVDRAVELLRAGATLAEAARAAEMSLGTRYGRLGQRWLTAEGLPKRARGQRRTMPAKILAARHERCQAVVSLRERGLTFAEIGAELGITRQGAHHLWLAAMSQQADQP